MTFDEDELGDLLEADLIEPEEVGYILCDGDCDDDQPCCAACEQEDEYERDEEKTASDDKPDADSDKEKIEEMTEIIREMMADIFGINVCVKYVPGK